MAFLRTISEEQVESLAQNQYNTARKTMGYVPNYVKAFSLQPEVYDAWTNLIGVIRSKMRLRRYELVTFAAAQALNCAYCMLAHGATLRKNFFNLEEMLALIADYQNAGLTPQEVALMSFSRKITLQAHLVNEKDYKELRAFGLTDEEIFDVTLACTARSFFSKTLMAVDAVPDKVYAELEPELLEKLSLGHPIEK